MSKVRAKLTRKNYSAEFKEETMKLITEQGYTLSEAASRLDINKRALVIGNKLY